MTFTDTTLALLILSAPWAVVLVVALLRGYDLRVWVHRDKDDDEDVGPDSQ